MKSVTASGESASATSGTSMPICLDDAVGNVGDAVAAALAAVVLVAPIMLVAVGMGAVAI